MLVDNNLAGLAIDDALQHRVGDPTLDWFSTTDVNANYGLYINDQTYLVCKPRFFISNDCYFVQFNDGRKLIATGNACLNVLYQNISIKVPIKNLMRGHMVTPGTLPLQPCDEVDTMIWENYCDMSPENYLDGKVPQISEKVACDNVISYILYSMLEQLLAEADSDIDLLDQEMWLQDIRTALGMGTELLLDLLHRLFESLFDNDSIRQNFEVVKENGKYSCTLHDHDTAVSILTLARGAGIKCSMKPIYCENRYTITVEFGTISPNVMVTGVSKLNQSLICISDIGEHILNCDFISVYL